MKRIKGVDGLRFILALWVLFGHFGFVPLGTGLEIAPGRFGAVVRAVYHNLTPGPVAVIVFFVISGFCIHYPMRKAERVDLLSFYSRRHIRILLPVAAALVLAEWQDQAAFIIHGILWSLVCEEIYYTIYPLLLSAKTRFGWATVLMVACVAALLVVLTNPRAADYASFGPQLNWVLGYPCWILGCVLAERIDADLERNLALSAIRLWAWRVLALSLAMFASMLRFHTPLTYPWTLDFFAVFSFYWIRYEIVFAESRGAPLLESLGAFSFSLYLMHWFGQKMWSHLALPSFGALPDWVARNIFVILVCYGFYLLVERPAHQLARHFQQMAIGLFGRPRAG